MITIMCTVIIYNTNADSGCVHIDTGTSPGTRIQVQGKKKIQCNPMQLLTFVRVVYESELPLNSTRTSRVCTSHVSREPVQSDYTK